MTRIHKLAGPSHSAVPVRADARISASTGGKLHLELVMRVGELEGARHIEGSSCADLAGATAVSLALLLRSPTPLSEGDLAGQDTTSNPETERPPPVPGGEHASTRPWRLLLQAPLGALGVGAPTEPSVGLSVAGGVSYQRWRFVVDGVLWRSQRMPARDEPGTGADVDLAAAGPRACWVIVQRSVELAPCLTLTLEHLRARGTGDHIVSRTDSATWVAAGLGADALWRLTSWLALVLKATAQIEASRPRIAIDGIGSLGQVGPIRATLALGPEWIF